MYLPDCDDVTPLLLQLLALPLPVMRELIIPPLLALLLATATTLDEAGWIVCWAGSLEYWLLWYSRSSSNNGMVTQWSNV